LETSKDGDHTTCFAMARGQSTGKNEGLKERNCFLANSAVVFVLQNGFSQITHKREFKPFL